jgi:hypothetical protein
LGEHEGGTHDALRRAGGAEHGAGEERLSGSNATGQGDEIPWSENARNRRAKLSGIATALYPQCRA